MTTRTLRITPRSSILTITADPSLDRPWALELRGGVSGLRADLSSLPISAISIGGGASVIALDLPQPTGRLTVGVAGGVSSSVVRRPAGVPVSVRIDGGASGLSVERTGRAAAPARIAHSDRWSGRPA